MQRHLVGLEHVLIRRKDTYSITNIYASKSTGDTVSRLVSSDGIATSSQKLIEEIKT